MTFIVATNVIASRPPERRPTGTPHACAKKKKEKNGIFSGHYVIASSLPPERLRPNDDRWNAARSCQLAHLGATVVDFVVVIVDIDHI